MGSEEREAIEAKISEHTQGRLALDAGKYEVRMSVGDNPVATCYDFTEESIANARRLVACWNACDGIGTYKLEAWVRHMDAKLPNPFPTQ